MDQPLESHAHHSPFSPAVQKIQARKGSRRQYERLEAAGGFSDVITPALAHFIEAQTSVFLSTADAEGQPYVQHRGGPPGFLRVLDAHTLGFVDFSGNRQFITQGNLSENPKAFLFLIDYANRQRVKIWGEARVVEDDPELMRSLMPAGYRARPEQVILFRVTAWDENCPQHIPRRADVDSTVGN